MDVTRARQTTGGKAAAGVMAQESGVRRMEASSAVPGGYDATPKSSGYGLPCAKCNRYYAANLDACPMCHASERKAPVIPAIPPKVAQSSAELAIPDNVTLEQEREEFLRQFKSQLFAAHAEVANVSDAICTLAEHHTGEPEKAEICKHCYDHLQERLDVCEAALHLDLKEAAQIIYDAVWADPSDPSKTYQNAATALLAELRKRAGISTLLGPFQTLSH
jgi:hypothetical protein